MIENELRMILLGIRDGCEHWRGEIYRDNKLIYTIELPPCPHSRFKTLSVLNAKFDSFIMERFPKELLN